MSSRRPADDTPTGQPDPKKPKMDIAAIRAQLAAKKAGLASGAAAAPAPAPASASRPAEAGPASNGRDDGYRSRDNRDEGRRDNGYGADRRDRGYDRDRDRDRERDRERDRDRDRYGGRERRDDRDRDYRDSRDRDRERDRDTYRDRAWDSDRNRDHGRERERERERDSPAARNGSNAAPNAQTTSPATRAAGPAALPPPPKMDMSVQDRVAAVKARIDAMNAKNAVLPGPSSSGPAPPLPSLSSSIALHPLLMGDGAPTAGSQAEKNEKKALRDRYKTMAPKFSTVRANQAAAAAAAAQQKEKEEEAAKRTIVPSLNPYSSGGVLPGADGTSGSGDAGAEGVRLRDRKKRQLQFARPGRFVEQGDQLRNEQKMEALKQRIAEASKKAGLEGEFDTLEKSLKRQPPPEVEWWDKAILPDGTTYDKLDETMDFLETNQDSLITHLVQHPIPIPAVGDKKAEERGLMLTKKEAKKLRRQRRMAELEDKRDRQKMGLLPPDPPKVRLANLMKVLTSDAVQDPTKVEAKVRREVAQRADKHEQDNAERKLSAEERKEKEYQQMLARERKGVFAAVFKVKYLSNGQHKFKVRETAKKDLLSGICLFGKDYAIVIVEGVDKSVKHYKKLMLSRIDWTEQARARPGEGGSDEDSDDDEKKNDGDLADNKCEMIWEGEVPERSFKMFRARHAETDSKAKEWLGGKWEGMWDLAKRWAWQGEDT